jgi:hypothetical protein
VADGVGGTGGGAGVAAGVAEAAGVAGSRVAVGAGVGGAAVAVGDGGVAVGSGCDVAVGATVGLGVGDGDGVGVGVGGLTVNLTVTGGWTLPASSRAWTTTVWPPGARVLGLYCQMVSEVAVIARVMSEPSMDAETIDTDACESPTYSAASPA